MQYLLFPAAERGTKDLGWLQSRFTFSFSSYYNPARNGFGLLKVFNDDVVQPGGGFGLHPHQNMEIISVLLAGRMNHKDTLGYSGEVAAGSVQIMSAGTGLRHEEHNIGDEPVHFLQIWIEPKLQQIQPRYQRRQFPRNQRHNRLVTIVSNEEGQQHCWINQNARLSLGWFDTGKELTYSFNPLNKGLFVFVISGNVEVNGIALAPRDAVGIWNTEQVNLHIRETAEFLIIETPINH
ncbi:MAG TPA: pirin family protein [Lacibacter sp.]|nr:pirin family protein [Lacibacter sp.]HMO90501.1 pirin family protein [Lacibacter sp.]HMP86600.1 pirin family protein [Lacibacter sp.]